MSNPLLWFLQHYLWDAAQAPTHTIGLRAAWTEGYKAVNRLFAQAIIEEAEGAPTPPVILIQDYQLYCVANEVRKALPNATIQQFVHIPWPGAQYWKLIPRYMRHDILHGMLGNSIIGFQTQRDARQFLDTVQQELGYTVDMKHGTIASPDGRVVEVHAYPISISVGEFEDLKKAEETKKYREQFDRERSGSNMRTCILRVDRTDLTKIIRRGFLAYERLLDQHPELRGTVEFWAFLIPTRQNVFEYQEYFRTVQEDIARINARFGTESWTPIRLEHEDNRPKGVAAYGTCNVLFVNPVFDGMNLVAKEGVICSKEDAVLVLSENAGAYEELHEGAVGVDPFDVDGQADALYRAMTMPLEERKARNALLKDIVRRSPIEKWVASQLHDLARVARQRRTEGVTSPDSIQ